MIYDSVRGKTVIFGGTVSSASIDETWEWDGTSFEKKDPIHVPSARRYTGLAYDSVREKTILFGGDNGSGDETWQWDGTDWEQLFPDHYPANKSEHAMAFDEKRAVIVLFGGANDVSNASTWEWNGEDWSEIIPNSTRPDRRRNARMVFDPVSETMIMFGGFWHYGSFQYSSETWQWDGVAWTLLNPSTTPPERSSHMMEYDYSRNSIVMYGGENIPEI